MQNILHVDKWQISLGSIIQNLMVNYPLVDFHPQQLLVFTFSLEEL